MFIVFGWGKRTHTDHGPTLPITCPKCHNQTYWRYKHYRTWFTLFFIPVIPYESDHYLLCDICQQGIVLGEHERERAKVLAGHTGMYLRQQLSQPEYEARLSEARLLG
jgi:hypothetical protein